MCEISQDNLVVLILIFIPVQILLKKDKIILNSNDIYHKWEVEGDLIS